MRHDWAILDETVGIFKLQSAPRLSASSFSTTEMNEWIPHRIPFFPLLATQVVQRLLTGYTPKAISEEPTPT